MPECLIVKPTRSGKNVQLPDGKIVPPPPGWECLPPGDAGLTRRVKAAGPSWQVLEQHGRKKFSHGLWAPAQNIRAARAALQKERASPEYARKLAASRERRAEEQQQYVQDFRMAIVCYLNFSKRFAMHALDLADRVTKHATPVGSGTVARTETIPIEKRASAAVIAWMRHQTTAYDHMKIARKKGERRHVRHELAQVSLNVLDYHRVDHPHPAETCPLCRALKGG
jgi:hypothetical protein